MSNLKILDSVENEIRNTSKVGSSYSLSEAKKIIASIHTKLGVKKKAKTTDLDNYFKTDRKKKRVNGISTGFVEILYD